MVAGTATWVIVLVAWAGALVLLVALLVAISRRRHPWRGHRERRHGAPDRRQATTDRRRGLPDPRELKVERRHGAPDRRTGRPERRESFAAG